MMKKKIMGRVISAISVLSFSVCGISASERFLLKSFGFLAENKKVIGVFCEQYSDDEAINELIHDINDSSDINIDVDLIYKTKSIGIRDRIAQAIQSRCQGKNITLRDSIQEVYSGEEESGYSFEEEENISDPKVMS